MAQKDIMRSEIAVLAVNAAMAARKHFLGTRC